jgi:hypothetical protein
MGLTVAELSQLTLRTPYAQLNPPEIELPQACLQPRRPEPVVEMSHDDGLPSDFLCRWMGFVLVVSCELSCAAVHCRLF